jgi:uncharacterized protein (DUF2249 family)
MATMSDTNHTRASHTPADDDAAQAIRRHHAELAATLRDHVTALVDAAEVGSSRQTWQQRDRLTAWLHDELLPHAAAEESALYPAAAAQPGGRLLVDGMVAEHRAITDLVAEIEAARTPVHAATAARALAAVFEVHLAKENDLILPLLQAAPDVSLADTVAGLHAVLGHDESRATGCGGHGHCGCGGDAGRADAPAPVLTIDARLDVRSLPHGQRHARVLEALSALPPDGALVLVAPHAPRPLLAEIDARYPGQFESEWLQEGPEVWQIRLHRLPVPA